MFGCGFFSLHTRLAGEEKYDALCPVVAVLVLLSHGQASVDMGFSVNKEIAVENQAENNLIARRVVEDFIITSGGFHNIIKDKSLLVHARSTRKMYTQYLGGEKDIKKKEKFSLKRKADIQELETMRGEAKRLEETITSLTKDNKKVADICKATGNIDFITKSNSFRRTAEEKQLKLDTLQKSITAKASALKQ